MAEYFRRHCYNLKSKVCCKRESTHREGDKAERGRCEHDEERSRSIASHFSDCLQGLTFGSPHVRSVDVHCSSLCQVNFDTEAIPLARDLRLFVLTFPVCRYTQGLLVATSSLQYMHSQLRAGKSAAHLPGSMHYFYLSFMINFPFL